MIKNINIVENVFSNPNEIVDLAKKQTYYQCKEHPSYTDTFYQGYRTKNLSEILSEDSFRNIHMEIFNKLIINQEYNCSYEFNFVFDSFFHYLTEDNVYDKTWIHTDDDTHNFLAGVIYLNENAPKSQGTKIFDNSGEVLIENVFNRGIMYNAIIPHSAESGFGKDLSDSRLTLTIFVKKMFLEMSHPNLIFASVV